MYFFDVYFSFLRCSFNARSFRHNGHRSITVFFGFNLIKNSLFLTVNQREIAFELYFNVQRKMGVHKACSEKNTFLFSFSLIYYL